MSASFKPDGTPTPAADRLRGEAGRRGRRRSSASRRRRATISRIRKRQRGKAAVDVLPDVLGGTLRGLTFPKLMHWDAMLEDGSGELLFGRPIRWMLFLYGGRVVPFTIARTPARADRPGAGRADRRRHLRPPVPDDQRPRRARDQGAIVRRVSRAAARELRHPRAQRAPQQDRARARREGAAAAGPRQPHRARASPALLHEVPDLVEYPSVIAGTFALEFLELPEEVLTTTLIHHQHYFPVEGEDGKLKNAFLAVINTEPDNERTIARNAERVVTRAAARRAVLLGSRSQGARSSRGSTGSATLLFHKKLGTLQGEGRADRAAGASGSRARRFGASDEAARSTPRARRGWRRPTSTTDMVREFTELQGTMGGIYARDEGLPEEVWKAIYYHYLPVGVEADAPPTRAQLGKAARHVGGRLARRQARHRSSACSRPARSRPARAIRTGCGGRRRASSGSSSICRARRVRRRVDARGR